MSQIPPTAITTAPTAPQRNDRTTFSTRVDAFVTWLITAVTEFNTLATNVYNNALDAYTNAVSAAASAASATSTSNVTKWVSGTSYTEGDQVWSPVDFLTYRRKVTGAGTTDPLYDSTNWARVSLDSFGKNLTVNGSCQISRINGSTIVTPAVGTSYVIDNVLTAISTASKLNCSQTTTASVLLNGATGLLTSVANTYSPAATNYFVHKWQHEGVSIAHLKWGTAAAKAISLQFAATASEAGTYSGSIINAASNRSYPFTFVLAANTPTQIKIENIPGDTSGTWPTGEVLALSVAIDLGCGTNYKTTANAWAAGTYYGVTGAATFVSQTGSSGLTISDLAINEGARCFEFGRKLYQTELAECQRYHPVLDGANLTYTGSAMVYSATQAMVSITLPVAARTAITGVTHSGAGILSCRQQGAGFVAATGIAFNRGGTTVVGLDLTGLSGLSGSSDCQFNQTGKLIFTGAEL